MGICSSSSSNNPKETLHSIISTSNINTTIKKPSSFSNNSIQPSSSSSSLPLTNLLQEVTVYAKYHLESETILALQIPESLIKNNHFKQYSVLWEYTCLERRTEEHKRIYTSSVPIPILQQVIHLFTIQKSIPKEKSKKKKHNKRILFPEQEEKKQKEETQNFAFTWNVSNCSLKQLIQSMNILLPGANKENKYIQLVQRLKELVYCNKIKSPLTNARRASVFYGNAQLSYSSLHEVGKYALAWLKEGVANDRLWNHEHSVLSLEQFERLTLPYSSSVEVQTWILESFKGEEEKKEQKENIQFQFYFFELNFGSTNSSFLSFDFTGLVQELKSYAENDFVYFLLNKKKNNNISMNNLKSLFKWNSATVRELMDQLLFCFLHYSKLNPNESLTIFDQAISSWLRKENNPKKYYSLLSNIHHCLLLSFDPFKDRSATFLEFLPAEEEEKKMKKKKKEEEKEQNTISEDEKLITRLHLTLQKWLLEILLLLNKTSSQKLKLPS